MNDEDERKVERGWMEKEKEKANNVKSALLIHLFVSSFCLISRRLEQARDHSDCRDADTVTALLQNERAVSAAGR